MKKVFATAGPANLSMIGPALGQLEEQGWQREEVLFAGHEQIPPPALSISRNPQPQVQPVYFILASKVFEDCEDPTPPTMDFSKLKGGFNGRG